MLRPVLALLSLASVAAAQVSLTHIGTVDLASATTVPTNPQYIGTNPIAVAWNGAELFVAGFNSSGAVGPAGITRITNPLSATPTFSPAFGVEAATPNSRGYSGLDVAGSTLVAAYDPGAVSPVGITAWDLAGASQWAKSGRGSSGVALDPGWFTLDAGAAWTTFGSGRRFLQDQATGADIYTSANGMIMNPTPSPGTTWRDMDFDTQTGDIWLRMGNKVLAGTRTGGNQLANQRVVVDATLATSINAQSLAFVRQQTGEVVFWNDRASGAVGQPFENVVKCNRASDGSAVAVSWGTFVANAGAGAYDFSYDEASKTLAICDYWNRAVYLFQVTIFASYGAGCIGASAVAPELTASGSAHANGLITYRLAQVSPLSIGLFAFGDSSTSVPVPFPYNCNLLVSPLLLVDGLFVTPPGLPASGSGTISVPVPPGVAGLSLTTQGWVLENGALDQLVGSNGVFTLTL